MPRITLSALAVAFLCPNFLAAWTSPSLHAGAGCRGRWQQGPSSRAPSKRSSINPPLSGIGSQGSDARAVALADAVMKRMGGRKAWDATRFLSWRFFGTRLHVWDRKTGDIRVEGQDRRSRKSYVILMNLKTRKGRAFEDGAEVTDSKVLKHMLDQGWRAWINDSYWLFMPYKLKDSGVTLKYIGVGKTSTGLQAEILELTFKKVGVTPENKYHVYVGRKSRLVEQWDYFSHATDSKPRMSTPWTDWKRYGAIMLSSGRGRGRITEIAVHTSLPRSVFASPAPVRLKK